MTDTMHLNDDNGPQDARPCSPAMPGRTPATLPAPLDSRDLAADVRLALDLSNGRPTGAAADAVRRRLRDHIAALADPADTYAAGLGDSRARDIAVNTVRHARAVATDAVGDPAANLRLLAKAVEHLARYAAYVLPAGPR
ncbi:MULTISPECIES: DUF6415 family natural product biosynthesis protein [unclassified Streptomyces]|uniref:DUF6415 family natural product biosynthesis protein n=1 Tax=unclassified Streptomyces TaxID=2593676 RepID=UPI0033CD5F4D